jgi:hypothetical protein
MSAGPPSDGLSGTELLLGTPEAIAYIRRLAPLAFPSGPPTVEEAAAVADAIWRRLRDDPVPEPRARDPEGARALRISAAFERGGLLEAFAEARRGRARGSRPAMGAGREEE